MSGCIPIPATGRIMESTPTLWHRFAARPIFALLTFVAAGLLIYAPALGGELIWDDEYLVGENPFFRSPVFGWEVFRHWLFFDSFSTYYRPVQNWSYILDYLLWRGEPAGYHLTNVLLHSFSAWLLYLLLRRLLPSLMGVRSASHAPIIALLVALVWTVHPIHNAAVAYISGRADSLASLFALAAWLLVLRAREVGRIGGKALVFTAAGVAILVALCSKEIALIWLLLFLFHLFAFEQAVPLRGKFAHLAGVAAVFTLYAVLHSLPEARAPMENGPPAPFTARVLLMFRALGDYTSLIFYPSTLTMERSLGESSIYASAASWRAHPRPEALSVLGLLTALAAIYLCRMDAPGRRLRWLGAGWWTLAFLPISNLFPLNAQVAEHWIYLASIGAFLFLAGCASALPARARSVAAGVVVLAIIGLGARTWVRAGDWVNAETFCLRTIASGGGTPRLLSALSGIYGERGDLTRQERLLRKTLERFPDFTPARINLGICLRKQGRSDEAAPLLDLGAQTADETARRYPRTWPAALQFARLRADAEPAEALAILAEARTRFPDTWELVEYQAALRVRSIGAAAALPEVERVAAARWWHLDAWLTLAELRAEAGDPDAAVRDLAHAARLDLYDARPFATLARIELERGRADAAIEAQCEAIARQPGEPSRYLALAAIFEKLGRRQQAEAAVLKARALSAGR